MDKIKEFFIELKKNYPCNITFCSSEIREEELKKVKSEEIKHQDNCSHVAFRFGGTENTQGFVKCLLCGMHWDRIEELLHEAQTQGLA